MKTRMLRIGVLTAVATAVVAAGASSVGAGAITFHDSADVACSQNA